MLKERVVAQQARHGAPLLRVREGRQVRDAEVVAGKRRQADALGPRRRDDPVAAPGEIEDHARDLVPRARGLVDAIEEDDRGARRERARHHGALRLVEPTRRRLGREERTDRGGPASVGAHPVPDEQLDGHEERHERHAAVVRSLEARRERVEELLQQERLARARRGAHQEGRGRVEALGPPRRGLEE